MSETTLGELDPEFCEFFKLCVREGRPTHWARVYLNDRFGFDHMVMEAV